MKVINREDLPSDYKEMMKLESHHDHEIIEDEKGTLRWKQDKFVNELSDSVGLINMIVGLDEHGQDKNSEVYRELYRKMGYSLSGYWEIFHWEFNNEDIDSYVQPKRVEL